LPVPENVIQCGNNESNSDYIHTMKELGRKIHPARFPASLPRFFINMLTDPGDLVMDPFAGSNTTGSVAEELGRRWIAVEKNPEYADDSAFRFTNRNGDMSPNGSGQMKLFERRTTPYAVQDGE
jgi:site-specific DNA-methyltransferase (cytosine-N4-specific)